MDDVVYDMMRDLSPGRGVDTRIRAKTSNDSNWLHLVGFVGRLRKSKT